MKYYLILIFAVIIGQSFIASLGVQYYNKQNPNITYWKACGLYAKNRISVWIVVVNITVVILFVMSDWFDLTNSTALLKTKTEKTYFELVQLKFRTAAVIFGMTAELVAMLVAKGARNAILAYGKSKGVDITSINNN